MGWSLLSLSSFTVVYFILCTVYLLVGVSRRSQWLKALLKCLPIASLLLLVALTSYRQRQTRSGETSEQKYSMEEEEKTRLLLLGLGLSIAGDALLVFRGTPWSTLFWHCSMCLHCSVWADSRASGRTILSRTLVWTCSPLCLPSYSLGLLLELQYSVEEW